MYFPISGSKDGRTYDPHRYMSFFLFILSSGFFPNNCMIQPIPTNVCNLSSGTWHSFWCMQLLTMVPSYWSVVSSYPDSLHLIFTARAHTSHFMPVIFQHTIHTMFGWYSIDNKACALCFLCDCTFFVHYYCISTSWYFLILHMCLTVYAWKCMRHCE